MKISFKYKIILLIILLEIFFLSFIILFNYFNTQKITDNLLAQKRDISSHLLTSLIKVPLSTFDFATLDNILESFAKNESIEGVKVLDASKRLLSTYSHKKNLFSELNNSLNNRYIVDTLNIKEEDISLGSVLIVYSIQDIHNTIRKNLYEVIFYSFLGLLLSTLIAYLLGNKAMSSLIKLKRAAESIALDENKKVDIHINTQDEFEYLSKSFQDMQNNLIERNDNVKLKNIELQVLNENLEHKVEDAIEESKKKDEILAHQAKLSAMGEMVGNIAHQWRQPLNALALKTQFLEDDYEDKMIDKEYLQEFSTESMNLINFMSKTIDDFRGFFKTEKIKKDFLILDCIKSAAVLLKPQLDNESILFNISGEDFTINAVENEMAQVILNIVNNAKDALIENKVKDAEINILLETIEEKGKITIADNAGGIPENVIDRIFEPYFTTKEEGKGTGIGLYMSKMIVDGNLQGNLMVTNSKDGARFEITLDLQSPPS